MEDLTKTQVRRQWRRTGKTWCKDEETLEFCSLNHLVRVERITEQTKQASGVSAFLDEELSLAPSLAVVSKGNLANDLLLR